MTAHKTLVKKEAEPLAQYSVLLRQIRQAIAQGKARAADAVERELVRTKWETGKLILEHILLHQDRAAYDQEVLKRLSRDLGISATELHYAVEFSRAYPIFRPAGKLSWSHYQTLLGINDAAARDKISRQAVREDWTRQRLRQEIQKLGMAKQISVTPVSAPEKLIAKKGTPYTYRVVDFSAIGKASTEHLSALMGFAGKHKGDRPSGLSPVLPVLKLDLGFSNYLSLSAADAKQFKPGDLVRSSSDRWTLAADGVTPGDLFTYHVQILDVTDGDTVWVLVDLGFDITTKQCLRLRGLDAPEIATRDGQRAKQFLQRHLKAAAEVLITSTKSDKYDRYLADIWAGDTFLNQKLLEEGHAVRVSE